MVLPNKKTPVILTWSFKVLMKLSSYASAESYFSIVNPSTVVWCLFIKWVQEYSQWACPISLMWSCIIRTSRMGLSVMSQYRARPAALTTADE